MKLLAEGRGRSWPTAPSPPKPLPFLPAMSGVTMLLHGLVEGSATCLNFQNEI